MAKLKDNLDALDLGTPMLTKMLGGEYDARSPKKRKRDEKRKQVPTALVTQVSPGTGGV